MTSENIKKSEEEENINKCYHDKYTFELEAIDNFILGAMGIILGLAVNKIGNVFYSKIGISNKTEKIIMQLLLCSIVLSFIHINISRRFGWSWQNITPGLFFVSYFFGTQFISFRMIREEYA